MRLSERRPGRGLAWMVLAQLCFAGMNVCTRLGSADLPWSEIAAARFAIGAFFALGSDRIGVGDAATLGATAPVFVALLSGSLLGERVGGHVSLAVALAFAGVIAVVRPSFEIAAPVVEPLIILVP